jgi:PTS system nitrogen regulatory IIA component
MLLSDLLTPERVDLEVERSSLDKPRALTRLASMLASGSGALAADVERVLTEREDLQSTGIGDGVAIPHGAMPDLAQQYAALLVAPLGVEFAAIDGAPVSILFAVIGPKRASGGCCGVATSANGCVRRRTGRSFSSCSAPKRARSGSTARVGPAMPASADPRSLRSRLFRSAHACVACSPSTPMGPPWA